MLVELDSQSSVDYSIAAEAVSFGRNADCAKIAGQRSLQLWVGTGQLLDL